MATQFIEQIIEDPFGRAQKVAVNLHESPLAWLHARGHLSERHYLAGDRLRADWEKAGLGPRVTMRWDAAPGQPRGGARGRQSRAWRSFRRGSGSTARSALRGQGWRMCCGVWFARARGWSRRKRRWAGQAARASWC